MAKWIVVVTLVALAAAACGSSSSSASGGSGPLSAADQKKAETTVAAQLAGSSVMDAKASECVAKKVVPNLSAKGRKLADNPSSEIAGLSKADQKVLYSSFDGCVTSAQLAPVIAKGLAAASPSITATVQSCFSSKLVAKYPSAGKMFATLLSSSGQSAVLNLMTSCGVSGLGGPTTTG